VWALAQIVQLLNSIFKESRAQTVLLQQIQLQQGSLLTNIQAQEADLLKGLQMQADDWKALTARIDQIIFLLTPSPPAMVQIVFGTPVHN
jgi:hypothetical protein